MIELHSKKTRRYPFPPYIQFFTSPGWFKVLSYLPLTDLESFAQAHTRLKKIMASYLHNDNALLITADTLHHYPIDEYLYVYREFASHTTNLCIDGVHELFLGPLFLTFMKISKLTVRNVTLTDLNRRFDVRTYRLSLRSLSLVNCMSSYAKFWNDLVRDMTSLEHLYLERNLPYFLLQKNYNIKSLTLVNQELSGYKFSCPNLTHLAIDFCWNEIPFKSVSTFGKLESLRVRQGVDWKKRLQVEALNLKSVDVHYWPIPTEENLILGLTCDCLLILQKYLTAEEWWKLQQTHPRLDALRVLDPHRVLKINSYQSLKQFPIYRNKQLYNRIGESVTRLDLEFVEKDRNFSGLKYFQRLTDLTIAVGYGSKFLKFIPSGLRVLYLNGMGTADGQELSKLFRRLDPTLRHLRMANVYLKEIFPESSPNQQGLNNLRHIEVFQANHLRVTREFLEFLATNKDTMRSLNVSVYESNQFEMELWPAVTRLRNLQRLRIGTFSGSLQPYIPEGALPVLQDLTIDCRPPVTYMIRLSNHAQAVLFSNQNSLELNIEDICKGMVSLEYLKIYTMESVNVNLFPHIFGLKKLKSVWVTGLEENHILRLVKGLPHLTELSTKTAFTLNTVIDTLDYLKQTGREVTLKNKRSIIWRQ